PASGNLQGKRRADALYADSVFPDEGRWPRDRISHPDLRHVVSSWPDDSQRVFLGDESLAGCDVSLRLVLENRHRRRWRVSIQSRRWHGWATERLPARRAVGDLCSSEWRHVDSASTTELYHQFKRESHLPLQPARPRPRELLLEHHLQPDLSD